MRIEIDSTFQEFSDELKNKVMQMRATIVDGKRLRAELRELRKSSFLLASKSFPDEIKELLNRHALVRRYAERGQKLDALLRTENITYNAFDELSVLQIITPADVLHEQYMDAEILAKEYFALTPDLEHFDLLIGFCEEPKVNEVLQLTFYLISGATVD